MFPKRKTGGLEVAVIIISIIIITVIVFLEIICSCLTQDFAILISVIIGIGTGLISAIALLFFREKQYDRQIKEYYTEISGEYVRESIGQDSQARKEDSDIVVQNIDLPICLRYTENHSFKITAQYWKNKGGEVEATIEFNEKNGMVASGRFRYTRGINLLGTSGIYTIYRLEEDKTKLLVLYRSLFPREAKDNPDMNKGWEIWGKVKNSCI